MSPPYTNQEAHPGNDTMEDFDSLREYMVEDVWGLLSNEASWLVDAIENIAEAFVYWGPDDRLVLCNSKYPSQFIEPDKVRPGVHFSELVEQNIRTGRVLSFNEIEDVTASPEVYREKRMEMHRRGVGTFEVKNLNGRWLQARERRTRDGGTVGIYTDITSIKEAEQREHESALAAEQANRAKSRFLAAASHDLRQPLHAMGILLSALSGRLQEPENKRLLQDVESCLNTMQSLFDALLDVSRLDAGVMQPNPQAVELDQLLLAIQREFAPQAVARNLDFRIHPCGKQTFSDPAMLGRILRNLIANAIKYTDRGGVLVAVRSQCSELALEVWDTGIGFPEEQIEKMFAEFQQLDVGKVRRQGLGLGLSIAQRLCDMLGHRIQVRSVEGRGSVFRVLIPFHQSQPEYAPTANSDSSNTCSGQHILVIDDEPDNLRASEILLNDWGFQVSMASTLKQAAVIQNRPDLILADFHLKNDETGIDLINLLEQQFNGSIPAVVITGDTEPEQLRMIQDQGFHVVHKPLKPMKLRAILQRYLIHPCS